MHVQKTISRSRSFIHVCLCFTEAKNAVIKSAESDVGKGSKMQVSGVEINELGYLLKKDFSALSFRKLKTQVYLGTILSHFIRL